MPNANSVITLNPALHHKWTPAQQKYLDILSQEENRNRPLKEIWEIAGFTSTRTWYRAVEDEQFVSALESLGVKVRRRSRRMAPNISVTLAEDPEEELAKDVWDLRRLKSDYPKHTAASAHALDFSWIENLLLRQQVKTYFRQHLIRWKAKTLRSRLFALKPFLSRLPPQVHAGTITREHIETLIPAIGQLKAYTAYRCMLAVKAFFGYMATSQMWTGPRPPRFLIWEEDIPSKTTRLPRPIPPDVVDQLDLLLEQAMQAMARSEEPPILPPMFWDAILILRRTGMRFEDLAHLKAPDEQDRNGCIDQDSDGYWWIRIHHKVTKMSKDHRIPTKLSDGVIDAVRRQRERVREVPDHFGEHYLFRTTKGVISYYPMMRALSKLAPQLKHEGCPYTITAHQFRHTIATDMIEQGVDIYTVKEFLGHASLSMTEQYVKVYLKSLKAKYDAYRAKKQQTYASVMLTEHVEPTDTAGEADGGWVENKVGKLYRSPLPDGIGWCEHLAMLDPCPTPPHCPTCPKLRASKRHLAVWESKANNLLITVESLRANPVYERARQRHEQELRHTEKVIDTIKKEGFWDGRLHNS